MNHKHFLFILVLATTACQPAPQESSSNSLSSFLKDNSAINLALDSLVANEFIPFVYARIENFDGQQLYEHSSVNKQLYPGLEVTKDSWFRIWSMSKIVTISLTMDLVEDGILDLKEPASKYIPEFEGLKVAVAADGRSIADIPWGEEENICPIKFVAAKQEMSIADLVNHKRASIIRGLILHAWTVSGYMVI